MRHGNAAICVLWLATAACGVRGPSPAVSTIEQYLDALRSGRPRDAYDLLSDTTRRTLSFDEFARQWKHTQAERSWQIEALETGIKGNPNTRELARMAYTGGNVMYLQREGNAWRLETDLASAVHAKRPRDVIERFANAIARRDIAAALDLLTRRRREAMAKQVEGFLSGLGEQIDNPGFAGVRSTPDSGVRRRIDSRLDHFGLDRAELRWDDRNFRYRIMLRKEAGDWRIDDIYIRPVPQREGPDSAGKSDPSE